MKSTFITYIILTISLTAHETVYSQSSIGFMAAYGASKFGKAFTDENYSTEYKLGNSYNINGFYEIRSDSTIKFKFGLTYSKQYLFLNVNKAVTHLSTNKWHLNYKNQFVKIDILSSIKCINKNRFKMNFLAGMFIKYNVRTTSLEYTTEAYQAAETDSNGITYYLPALRNVEIDNKNSKDFKPINIGLESGLEVNFPLSSKFCLVVQNRYSLDILNSLKIKDLNYTLILSTSFNFGFRYTIR
jgi:hypothetical protein